MRHAFCRRDLLWAGLSLSGLGAAAARGQSLGDIEKLFGGKLPDPLRAALPAELGQAAQIVAEVLRLEQQARTLRLPPSALSVRGGIPTDPDQLYAAAMPRLVALIDSAAPSAPTLADQAGGLLARLHHGEFVPAEAWKAVPAANLAPFAGDDELDVHPPGVVPSLRLADPHDQAPETGTTPQAEAQADRPDRSLRFGDIAGEYRRWFDTARIRPEHQERAAWHLTMLRQSRGRYAALGKSLGVPWYFIGAVHGLEASFNFRAHLHNGDFPLTQRTRQVPAGRPLRWLPPSDWEDSAADALRLMGFADQADWSLPRVLYRLEAYNGFGYRRAGRSSPYLWSFSTQYDRRKFVADGRFDPRARSQQCGAAVMLRVLADAGEIPELG